MFPVMEKAQMRARNYYFQPFRLAKVETAWKVWIWGPGVKKPSSPSSGDEADLITTLWKLNCWLSIFFFLFLI